MRPLSYDSSSLSSCMFFFNAAHGGEKPKRQGLRLKRARRDSGVANAEKLGPAPPPRQAILADASAVSGATCAERQESSNTIKRRYTDFLQYSSTSFGSSAFLPRRAGACRDTLATTVEPARCHRERTTSAGRFTIQLRG